MSHSFGENQSQGQSKSSNDKGN